MSEPKSMTDSDNLFEETSPDPFAEAVQEASAWDVVYRPRTKYSVEGRIQAARQAVMALEQRVARAYVGVTEQGEAQGRSSVLLDVRSNLRLMRAAALCLKESAREAGRIPRILRPAQQAGPRIAALARLYLRTAELAFSAETLSEFLRRFQLSEPLTVSELWQLPAFLKFAQLEVLLEELPGVLQTPGAPDDGRVQGHLKSLRAMHHTDWGVVIEPLIVFDATLRMDPAGTYEHMDFESRELYRRRVAHIARHSDCSEVQVAGIALDLARGCAALNAGDSRMKQRRVHIGYYLLDKGFSELARRVGYHPRWTERTRTNMRAQAEDVFITGIMLITLVLMSAVLFPLLPRTPSYISLLVAAVLLALPAMQGAVDLVNAIITALFDPEPLPKLDFSHSIPAAFTTLVAVPSLLLNEEQVRGLVADLEVRFLANHDPHLHFALLTDLPDSVTKPHENDSHPLVELAVRLLEELNAKYDAVENGSFMLLHRHRTYNRRQGVWMGWERKRGKLLDLNKLLMGEYDAFPIKAGKVDALHDVRYILTLDSDSQLPHGAAARLAGAMAHPLNQAIIDPKSRTVTAGYGILQPRVGIAVQSASRSRLARMYSGQTGFDIYSRAVSDAYQDLFGEGIFTGKGIYEVATLHAVLDKRFPRNALLSHDLIEGAYARAGLVTDVEVIDDYPSHYSAYSRRKHRWVRGDWQIVQWMFSHVPEESGKRVRNPISDISRWKIFDNLRRSLVDPAMVVLFLAGWLGLPGGPLYWTVVPLAFLLFPVLVQFGFALGRAWASGENGGTAEAFAGLGQSALVVIVNFALLLHQMLLAVDAVVRSLVRRYITGERLLEWETAAQAERSKGKRTPVDRYLMWTPMLALALGALVYFVAPHHRAIYYASPILGLWALSFFVPLWLNKPTRDDKPLKRADAAFLRRHALRIWRYFEHFGTERHNFLIPDNVMEEGFTEAARVSPTNIGLLLNARQAACALGFITAPECVALTQNSLTVIARLAKHRGHLFNWYDTKTLLPLDADPFVSTVDSGNFVASLYTLQAGAHELLKKPLLRPELFAGVRTYWQQMELDESLAVPLRGLVMPASATATQEWIAWLPAAQAVLSAAAAAADEHSETRWWLTEAHKRVTAILILLRDYLPWMLPEYAPIREMLQPAIGEEAESLSFEEIIGFTQALGTRLSRVWSAITAKPTLKALGEQLRAALPVAQANLRALAGRVETIAQQAERLAAETDFAFLADPGRGVLSIGYSVRSQKRHEACYDLLASEARMATFLAVARGELPQQSWFKLGRQHVHAFGRFVLYSWTGTMFEYLMPTLWMHSDAETLLGRTQLACVDAQRAFARTFGIPWGISESGNATRNEHRHYGYHAYGVPQMALSEDATAGPVVSPYSSFLALGVETREALRNLRQMDAAGWVGAFGLYEAADYRASRENPELVREWMAHHLGMSLLAVTNLLESKAVQRWFHANRLVQASELLLEEMPVRRGALHASLEEYTATPASRDWRSVMRWFLHRPVRTQSA
ncbi:MAG: glycosyl transferase [Acidobacteriota bacterium]|nr:glycosyl transferase [Acidobacteriota bacterium]